MPASANIQGSFTIQGNLRNTYGPDLLTWINDLSSYSLPLPSNTVLTALERLMNGLVRTDLRTKIKRLNLFCGGDWRGSFFPIIKDIGAVWDWNGRSGTTAADLVNGPFQASDWALTTGFDPSRVNQTIQGNTLSPDGMYLDTGIPANNSLFQTDISFHFACHVNSLGIKGADDGAGNQNLLTEIGAVNSVPVYGGYQFALRASYKSYFNNVRGTPGFLSYSQSYGSGTSNALLYTSVNSPFDPRGLNLGIRTNIGYSAYYKGTTIPAAYGVSGYSNPNFNDVTGGVPSNLDTTTITIFSDGYGNGTGRPAGLGAVRSINRNYSDRQITMYSIGTGLTNTDVTNFNTLVSNFNTAVGRTNY